eukprot:156135_1
MKQKLNDDSMQLIIKHTQFDVLEYKFINKIIEYQEIEKAIQWFSDEINMKIDQILIVEILASKRRYINCEYMTKYLENPSIDEITRINYLKLCGITESLGGIEQCFRHFFSRNCCLYMPSFQIFNYQLLCVALSKTMLLNGNITKETHRKQFENDPLFIAHLIHRMFGSTAKSSHFREISTNPWNPQMAAMSETHSVIADILEIFEQNGILEMEYGLDEIATPEMVQVTF